MADTKEFAQGYSLVNDTQHSTGQFLIQRLDIQSGMHILDVGCANGNLTSLLADLVGGGGTVVGIDPSQERIAIARELARPNLSFYEGKAEDLSRISSASMDAVFVNSTFHWVQDQASAMNEFARVLKPGGRVGISGGSGDYLGDHERIKGEVLSREPFNSYPEKNPPKFLKRRELESLLDTAGFSKKDIIVRKIIKKAKDGESMMEWLDTSSSGKTYGGIPLDFRPKAKAQMVEEWAKLATSDGLQLEIELLVTVAFKSQASRVG